MIHIRKQPETKTFLPQPITLAWIKGADEYRLEMVEAAPDKNLNAGWGQEARAKISLLESGAVLASFPLLGKLPGAIQTDPYTTWFELDAPAIIPAGIFGWEIEIAAGRHLMALSLGAWVVFFKPLNPEKRRSQSSSLVSPLKTTNDPQTISP